MEAKDRIQKSKVKWAVEGDENSKFFHGIINKRRSQLAIREVFVDGIWRSDPVRIKNIFFDHFEARFKKPADHRFKLNFQFHKILLKDQADDLERGVSRDEIRRAVWNCGDNKSPGPDGFTFELPRNNAPKINAPQQRAAASKKLPGRFIFTDTKVYAFSEIIDRGTDDGM
ncbi:hypothetical protein Tco_0868448 [Tanacetum coccineum]